jgi:hypothetical protein
VEEFSRLMARFYGRAARVIDDSDGIVDKFVGDGVVALFIPGFSGGETMLHTPLQPQGDYWSRPATTRPSR